MFVGEHASRSIRAAWAVVLGKPGAMAGFDVSPDGFWRSFMAIMVALPAMLMGWLALARNGVLLGEVTDLAPAVAAYAAAEVAAWVLPLAALGLAARPLGFGDRFAPYAVATNWGSVITSWAMAPMAVLRYFLPGEQGFTPIVGFAAFGFALAVAWRLTDASLGKGPLAATAVFLFMFVAGIAVLSAVRSVTGM